MTPEPDESALLEVDNIDQIGSKDATLGSVEAQRKVWAA